MVSWLGYGCSAEPWVLCLECLRDHGQYHAPPPPMKSDCVRPWYHGCHGCSVEPGSIALDHGRCHESLPDPRPPIESECIRPWYHGSAMDALLGPDALCSECSRPWTSNIPWPPRHFPNFISDKFLLVSDARWFLMRRFLIHAGC